MNPSDQKWTRLVAAARSAPDDRDLAAPYGFSTRVAALAFAQARSSSLLERFSLRALGVAALLALGCVAANYFSLSSSLRYETALTDDPVEEVVDVAS
jgi:hypothetical protein